MRKADIPRASTYQNMNVRYSQVAHERADRLSTILVSYSVLKRTLEQHRAGYSNVKAADVYQAALELASHAIALAEHGTEGYPYASHIPTGQGALDLK